MKISEMKNILKKTGDISSLYSIKDITYNEGRERGVHAYNILNGKDLNVTVFADRGLDIPVLKYRGYNIGFLSKSGLSSPYLCRYTPDGLDSFLRQFPAGFMTTCGMTYAGAPCEDQGQNLSLHGAVSNSIAENVYACTVEEDDEVVLKVYGEIREARLFAENMILHREIKIYTESNIIKVHDVIENRGFMKSPLIMIYHVNFGYPILDAGARVYSNSKDVIPQSDFSKEGIDKYHVIEEPEDSREEQCYYHVGHEKNEQCFAMIHNERLGIAVAVKYKEEQCPILCQWKSMQSGDYALGLEPTTSGIKGRKSIREEGKLIELEPMETYAIDLEFDFMDDVNVIESLKMQCKENNL